MYTPSLDSGVCEGTVVYSMSTLTDKEIFKAMQAIQRAYLRCENKSDAARLDPTNLKQAYPATKYILNVAFPQFKKDGFIFIELRPGEGEHPTNRHFQFRKTKKFGPRYKQLERKYPDLQELPAPNKNIKCGNLIFNPESGKFKYGDTKEGLKPNSATWSVFYQLLLERNKSVLREDLAHAIVVNWKKSGGKKKIGLEDDINIPDVIGQIRSKMRMGRVTGAVNKDLIKSGEDGLTYRLICS